MADDNSGVNYSTCAVTLSMATIFVGARVYCSTIKLGRWLYEDGILVVSVILLWVAAIFFMIATSHGVGRHVTDLTYEEEKNAKFNYLICLWPAVLAIGIPKVAVAGLSCRIFMPGAWHRTFMLTAAYIGIANYVTVALTSMLSCLPVASYWDSKIIPTVCVNTDQYIGFNFYAGVYSAVLDFYLAVYPAFAFRGMPFISLSKKIGLSCVLGLGIFATTTACLKITYIMNLRDLSDFTWKVSPLMQWTIVEAAVIITAACIPTLRPLFESAREVWYTWFPEQRRIHTGPRVHVYHSHPSGSSQSSPFSGGLPKDKQNSSSWKSRILSSKRNSVMGVGRDPHDDTARIIPKPASSQIVVETSVALQELESGTGKQQTRSTSPADLGIPSEGSRGGTWLDDPTKSDSRCWH